MNELAVRLGKNIAGRRKALGITQAVLAEVVNVDEETISRFERGMVTPSLATLDRLATALDCGLEHLVSGVSDNLASVSTDLAKMLEPLAPNDRRLVKEIVASLAQRLQSGK